MPRIVINLTNTFIIKYFLFAFEKLGVVSLISKVIYQWDYLGVTFSQWQKYLSRLVHKQSNYAFLKYMYIYLYDVLQASASILIRNFLLFRISPRVGFKLFSNCLPNWERFGRIKSAIFSSVIYFALHIWILAWSKLTSLAFARMMSFVSGRGTGTFIPLGWFCSVNGLRSYHYSWSIQWRTPSTMITVAERENHYPKAHKGNNSAVLASKTTTAKLRK